MAEVVKMRGALGSSEDRFWQQLRGRVDDAVGADELGLEEAEARMAIAGEEPVDPERVARVAHDVAALEAVEGVGVGRAGAPVRLLRMPLVRAAAVVLGVVLAAVAAKTFLSTRELVDPTYNLTYAHAIEVLANPGYLEGDRHNAAARVLASVMGIAVPGLKKAEVVRALSGAARGQLARIQAALEGPVQELEREMPASLRVVAATLQGLAATVDDASVSSERRLDAVNLLGDVALHGVRVLRRVEATETGDLLVLARSYLASVQAAFPR